MADSPGSYVTEPSVYSQANDSSLQNTSKYAEGAMNMSFYEWFKMRGKGATNQVHWDSIGFRDSTGAKAPESVTDIVVEDKWYSTIT